MAKITAEEIIKEKDYYKQCSQAKRQVWMDCWKHYVSWHDSTKNPFLSNLFIPKTHEAVELLAAFLAGANQVLQVDPEGADDTDKARIIEKLLDFKWRKVLDSRRHVKKWIKQGILFGNGFIKVGWDSTKKEAFQYAANLPDIFMDFYSSNIADSYSIIQRIPKLVDQVKKDERYNKEVRNRIIPAGDDIEEEQGNEFGTFDGKVLASEGEGKKTELYEHWCPHKNLFTTIGRTSFGWEILRQTEMPYKDSEGEPFLPFIKVDFKTSPLPNRAYDIGAIEPTLKLQLAFNDLMNEYFDNVSLINNKQWIVRKSAGITPMDLVRRPGGIIQVTDINADIRAEEVGDIKNSLIEMIERLDNEFQQSSMVVNLLKAMPGADTATEASLAQQNSQTLMEDIDENIKQAMSELGTKLFYLYQQNATNIQNIPIFENDDKIVFAQIEPRAISGKFDIKITADRSANYSKVVKQKQLLDFLAIVTRDQAVMMQYPDMTMKVYKKWLEEAGFSDVDYFFENKQMMMPMMPPQGGGPGLPGRDTGLSAQANQQMAMAPQMYGA